MHRAATALALSLAAAASAACSGATGRECPGTPVAEFHFTGVRVYTGDPLLAGLDPVPSVPDCPPEVGPPPYPDTLPPFDAILAAEAFTQAAALCRPAGIVLHGQRTGSRYVVEGSTPGAVLYSCSPTCAAALRLVVAGDVIASAGGAPAAFQGLLVEVMTRVEGDCGTCLPAQACAARYALGGAL